MLDTSFEHPSILIDCTMVATTAAYIKDYANPDQAAEQFTRKKIDYYSKYFDIADNSRASLIIFAVETSGDQGALVRKLRTSANSLVVYLERIHHIKYNGYTNRLQSGFRQVGLGMLICGDKKTP